MEKIGWKVQFGTLGETRVSAQSWYKAVREASIKLGLQGRYPMTFLLGLASVTKLQPKTPGRKKKFWVELE